MGNVRSCVRKNIEDWDYHGATVGISMILNNLDRDDRRKVLKDMFMWYPEDIVFGAVAPYHNDEDVTDS